MHASPDPSIVRLDGPPHELFKRRPFMERTVRDDLIGLVAGLVGFTAAYLLSGDVAVWPFAIVVGVGLLVVAAQGCLRHVIRQRRDARSGFPPPE